MIRSDPDKSGDEKSSKRGKNTKSFLHFLPFLLPIQLSAFWRELEGESQSEPEDSFIDAFTSVLTGAGDLHISVQSRSAVGVQQDVASGVPGRRRHVSA